MINGGLYGGMLVTRSYIDRFLTFWSLYSIPIDGESAAELFLFGQIPKTWVGINPYMLSHYNPYTSVLRGIFLDDGLALLSFMRAYVFPMMNIIATFIGVYNFTILVEAAIYAAI